MMPVFCLILVPSPQVDSATIVPVENAPSIHLSKELNLPAKYEAISDLRQMQEDGSAVPVALASGDFDEDGLADLISAYFDKGGGLLNLHLRKMNSIAARNNNADSQIPFHISTRVFATSEIPEFLGVGDFDADGHADVVVAARRGNALQMLKGDGIGGFITLDKIELPGTITAFTTGEMNRADGLTDVIVAVSGADGAQILVFEGPEGALLRKPEMITLPSEATALALGHFDNSSERDLALTAGNDLILIHGRDRRLYSDQKRVIETAPPVLLSLTHFSNSLISITTGNFTGDQKLDLALLGEDGSIRICERTKDANEVGGVRWLESRMILTQSNNSNDSRQIIRVKISNIPRDDLLLIDSTANQLFIITNENLDASDSSSIFSKDLGSEPIAVLPMRLNQDALSDLVILKRDQTEPVILKTEATKTYTINSNGDQSDATNSGDGFCDVDLNMGGEQCTLRAAMEDALNFTRDAEFKFDLPLLQGNINVVNGPLPSLLGVVTFDGALDTIPPVTKVSIDGGNANGNGLQVMGGTSVVRNTLISHFSGHGILISGTGPPGEGGHLIENNAIDGNGGHGIFIDGGTPNNTIQGNEIAFNKGDGVNVGPPMMANVGGGNTISGNPLISLNDGKGVSVEDEPGNTVKNNNISKNKQDGVLLKDEGSQDNLVQGNSIGTDGSNGGDGVVVQNSAKNTVGGTGPGQGNTLAGDNNGVKVDASLLGGIKVTHNMLKEDGTGATFSVGFLVIKSGSLLDLDGNIFEKLDEDGAAIKAHLNANTNYNFRDNRFETKVKQGTAITFEEGLTLELNYSGNIHTNNDLAFQLVESIGELKLTSTDMHVNGGAGTEFIVKAKGEKNMTGWMFTGGGSFKFAADLNSDFRATMKAEGWVMTGSNSDAINGTFSGLGDLGFALLNTQIEGAKKDGFRLDAFAGLGAELDVNLSDVRIKGVDVIGSAGLRFTNGSASIDLFRADIRTSDFKDFDTELYFFDIQLKNSLIGNDIGGGNIGIVLDGSTVANISGNTISGNITSGVLLQASSSASISDNTISGNGVAIAIAGTGTGTELLGNSIFGNTGLGMDLGNDGVTQNDAGDIDAGPNNLQNFPVITNLTPNNGSLTIDGTLNSTPNTTFHINFFANTACNPSGFGEGETFLGFTDVTTDSNGDTSFSITFLSSATIITATATDPLDNSSEFSRCGKIFTDPAQAIQDLIVSVQSMGLSEKLENSLVSKLEKALVKLNKGKEEGAIKKLQSFINKVNKKRGKGLSDQQADQLVASAQLIIDELQTNP